MTKLVIYRVGGGYVKMRCEHHAPAHVQEWLAFADPPGFIHVEEVSDTEAQHRCNACLSEMIIAERPELGPIKEV